MDTKAQTPKVFNELYVRQPIEDKTENLHLLYKVSHGIAQADAGQTITQAEARQRMARWLK